MRELERKQVIEAAKKCLNDEHEGCRIWRRCESQAECMHRLLQLLLDIIAEDEKIKSQYSAFISGLNPSAMTKEAETFIVNKFVKELKCEDFLTDIFGEKVYFIEEKKLDQIAKILTEGKDEKS